MHGHHGGEQCDDLAVVEAMQVPSLSVNTSLVFTYFVSNTKLDMNVSIPFGKGR